MINDKEQNRPFYKRDVQLAINEVANVIKTVNGLSEMGPCRETSIAATHLDTAYVWLKQLHTTTTEG